MNTNCINLDKIKEIESLIEKVKIENLEALTNICDKIREIKNDLNKSDAEEDLQDLLMKSIDNFDKIMVNCKNESLENIEKLFEKGLSVYTKYDGDDLLTHEYYKESAHYRACKFNCHNWIFEEKYKLLGDLMIKYGFRINMDSFKYLKDDKDDEHFDELEINYFDYLVKNIHPSDIKNMIVEINKSDECTKFFKDNFKKKIFKFHKNEIMELMI